MSHRRCRAHDVRDLRSVDRPNHRGVLDARADDAASCERLASAVRERDAHVECCSQPRVRS